MATSTLERSPLVHLRERLDELERAIVAIYTQPGGVSLVLRGVDEIEALLRELDTLGLDLRGEQSRTEGLLQRLEREARKVRRKAQATGEASQLQDSPTWQMVAQA